MESWITWIIQVVAYGIICFLLKRELNQFDQRDKRLQERIDISIHVPLAGHDCKKAQRLLCIFVKTG